MHPPGRPHTALFESAVIIEYLEEVHSPALHPSDPLSRADHRAWIVMSSAILDDIAGLYSAPDAATFEAKRVRLAERFARLEARLEARPWFDGSAFRLVDAVYGPVFRYLDAFDRIVDLGLLAGRPKLGRWRKFLRERPSIRAAVEADHPESLMAFLAARPSHLARLIGLLRAA